MVEEAAVTLRAMGVPSYSVPHVVGVMGADWGALLGLGATGRRTTLTTYVMGREHAARTELAVPRPPPPPVRPADPAPLTAARRALEAWTATLKAEELLLEPYRRIV